MGKFKYLKKEGVGQLPKTSGVYFFKRVKKFLYIGKASNIRERVRNHFQQSTYRDNLFINQVSKVGYLKTNSEIEALILESNLIKKYQPRYNVVWRDDKNYFYVGITKDEYPAIFITHQIRGEAKFVGPFVDGKSLKATLKILRKVFPYRTCKTLPKRPCLWYQLNRCPAPCLLKSKLAEQIPTVRVRTKREVQRNAKNLYQILQGKKNQVLKNLKKEMAKASKEERFEEAAKIRDQIESLEKVLVNAKIFELEKPIEKTWLNLREILQKILKTKKRITRIEAYDVSNIQGKEAAGSMVTFIKGLPNKNFYRRFKIKIATKPDDIAMIKECLRRRFKHLEWGLPDLILIDGGKAQLNAARKVIKNKIPLISLAKKENKLFIWNKKSLIMLKKLPREIFNLILQLRDETHRFAISYHKILRERSLFKK
jgi:excinuclease ABC subunit C